MHCADVLFPLLSPAEKVQMALCNANTLKKLPVSKLYFTDIPHSRLNRIRKLIHSARSKDIRQGLTHLKLRGIVEISELTSLSNLIYLEIESCFCDLVLPENLRTFIGLNIKSVTIPLSLTSLCVKNSYTHITGLDSHPNLTVLKFGGTPLKFEMPPNLVEFDMPDDMFPVTCFPQTLRILRMWPQIFPICSLPPELEQLCFKGLWYDETLPKLPHSLRWLEIPGDCTLKKTDVAQCTKLTKLVLCKSPEGDVTRMLTFSDLFIPNLSELHFSSREANTRLENLKFSKLTRLTIHTKNNYDKAFQFQQRLGLTFLNLSFGTLAGDFRIDLPPRIRILKLLQTQMFGIVGCRITIDLPNSLKVLEVSAPQRRFYISVSREHLSRLDVIGDRGQAEANGRIVTSWGAFIIV